MSSRNGKHQAEKSPLDDLYDTESEAALLGCISQDRRILSDLKRSGVSAPWFSVKHALWFNLFRLLDSRNSAIDFTTVGAELKGHTSWRGLELADMSAFESRAVSPSNWPYYIPPIRECFFRRQSWSAAQNVIRLALDRTLPPEGILDDLKSSIDRLAPGPALPDILDASVFVDSQIPVPPELVRGLLHKGTKFSLGGGSKTCKSWVLLDLCLSVANGSPWLGMDTLPGKVLFVNMEIPDWAFRRRIARVLKEKEAALEPGAFDIWNLRGMDCSADLLLPKISETAKQRGYALIIIDPIYKTYGNLKENAAEDMNRLMQRFESLCFETGAAVGFAAHFSKGNQSQKDSLDRISGSGVFARDPDSIFTLTALNREACFAFDAGGLRNFAPLKPFGVQWKFPLMVRNDDLNPADLKKANGRPKSYDLSKIIGLLIKPLTTSQWQKVCSQELGTTKGSFYRAIEELTSSKLASKDTSGLWTVTIQPQMPYSDPDVD